MPVFLFGCLFSLIWSSAFIAGKVSLDYATPLNFLFFRFVSAGGLLLAACWLLERCRKRHTIPADARMWRIGSLLGLFNYALYLGFSYTGLQTIAPQLVILLVATTPFATSLLAAALNRSRLKLRQLSAIGIGFGGVYFVLSDRLAQAAFGIGVLWVLSGVAALAAGTVYYRRAAAGLPPLPLIGVQNLVGGLLLLPFADFPQLAQAVRHADFVWSWLYQVVMISMVSMWMWFALVRRLGAESASVFHLMNPVFGLLLSAWFFHSDISGKDMLGTAIVVAGMALAVLPARKRAPA